MSLTIESGLLLALALINVCLLLALWWRKPMAFVGMAAFFLLAVTLIMSVVPVLGPVLGMGLAAAGGQWLLLAHGRCCGGLASGSAPCPKRPKDPHRGVIFHKC